VLSFLACALLLGACRAPAPSLPLAEEEAQAALRQFAAALGAWDIAKIEALIVGGAKHPMWAVQRSSLEGRGIRFIDVEAGFARRLTEKIAVGPVKFRLSGNSVDDKMRVTRVALVRIGGAWKVSFWGQTLPLKRHLRWLRMGGDPLQDPSFRYLK
jgi:hypothetical protein